MNSTWSTTKSLDRELFSGALFFAQVQMCLLDSSVPRGTQSVYLERRQLLNLFALLSLVLHVCSCIFDFSCLKYLRAFQIQLRPTMHKYILSGSFHMKETNFFSSDHGVIHTFVVMCHPFFVTFHPFSSTPPAPILDSLTFFFDLSGCVYLPPTVDTCPFSALLTIYPFFRTSLLSFKLKLL